MRHEFIIELKPVLPRARKVAQGVKTPVAPIQRSLVLAYQIDEYMRMNKLQTLKAFCKAANVSPGRVTQILKLMQLSPKIHWVVSPGGYMPEQQQESSIAGQISALYNLSIQELKSRYTALGLGDKPPTNKDFLIRHIAYKLQENAFGGLPSSSLEALDTLKSRLDPIKTLGTRKTGRKSLMPGTVISKTYKGVSISVKVLPKGFEYNGKPYKSLSRIAEEITGVHQSGFVFFGL